MRSLQTVSRAPARATPADPEPEPDSVAALADELASALSLLRRMLGSQTRTLAIARQLMLAQDLAERHRSRVGPAVDEAAASDGDPDAIERAVRAVAVADAAADDEWALSRDWAAHICGVHDLAEEVDCVLSRSAVAYQPDA